MRTDTPPTFIERLPTESEIAEFESMQTVVVPAMDSAMAQRFERACVNAYLAQFDDDENGCTANWAGVIFLCSDLDMGVNL